jgi:4-hydroxy-tetrahydrodipicolinate reductase
MTLRVGVLGAAGRMGHVVSEGVAADPDLDLVIRVDPQGGDGISTSLDALVDAGADVAIDFTQPDQVFGNVTFCLEKGIHVVVGTTGMTTAELEKVGELASAGSGNVFVAPNFSIGAVLMMHLAKQAARYLGSCEIVEMHHNHKLDAPSVRLSARPKASPPFGRSKAGPRKATTIRTKRRRSPAPVVERWTGSTSTPCACRGARPTRK